MFELVYYHTSSGKMPVADYIATLSDRKAAKVMDRLKMLNKQGNNLRYPYSSPARDGIFELRVKLGTDIFRIFYFFAGDNTIILSNGYTKKQEKMDPGEFSKAQKYKADYETRKRKNKLGPLKHVEIDDSGADDNEDDELESEIEEFGELKEELKKVEGELKAAKAQVNKSDKKRRSAKRGSFQK
ncbi:MAG: type II toxin-antitoxin system RelE/ParE family toxin [Clostridia bacterium]|nr:type II toxin-antitoxin system RelE/ParE family toxin [Clostridia bacterium]